MYVCMYVCMHACMYVCMYIYIYNTVEQESQDSYIWSVPFCIIKALSTRNPHPLNPKGP